MRKLTIKRRKRAAGGLIKDTLYIEDITSSTTMLDIPCRKLGILKNGEEKSFEISEGQARLIVMPNIINIYHGSDIAEIPWGTEDVVLCGQHYFDTVRGNSFRFDGTPSLENEEKRESEYKERKRKFILSSIIAAIAGVVAALLVSRLDCL